MSTKNCNQCNAFIIWPEIYKRGQKPLNLDGSIHFCNSIKPFGLTKANRTISEILEGHTKLFAKLIQRIEILEKRMNEND